MSRDAEIHRRDIKPCALCSKGLMHTGIPLFYRVTVQRFGFDALAIDERRGLELMLGSPVLAEVMGSRTPLAKALFEPAYSLLICEECAMKMQMIPHLEELGAAEREAEEERAAMAAAKEAARRAEDEKRMPARTVAHEEARPVVPGRPKKEA